MAPNGHATVRARTKLEDGVTHRIASASHEQDTTLAADQSKRARATIPPARTHYQDNDDECEC